MVVSRRGCNVFSDSEEEPDLEVWHFFMLKLCPPCNSTVIRDDLHTGLEQNMVEEHHPVI